MKSSAQVVVIGGGVVGASVGWTDVLRYDPVEGHVDPSGVTRAYVKCAQMAGAEVRQHTPVVGLSQRTDGTWDVRVENGDVIHAEHVVNAGGLWAREVGRMVGIELPVLAMEHMYLLTQEMPEVAANVAKTGKEMPMALDFAGEIYIRQEGGGMLHGTYEQAAVPWSPRETPWDFGSQLLKPDLDRITPELEVAFRHYPSMATTGIRQVVNGPFTFSPDGNPLVGPVRGLRGFWVACGVMAGLSQGGGVGLALATWMTAGDHGDSGMDIWAMDVARYGDYATLAFKLDHEFIGRAAHEAELAAGGPKRRLVTFVVEPDPDDPADVIGDEPVWHGGQVVGWITSGGYGHHVKESIALGYVPTELAAPDGPGGDGFEIEIIGWRRPARLQPEPLFDPKGLRMRQ